MLMPILRGLGQQFTAQDIMIPKSRLVCASDEQTAIQKLHEYPDFNLIPIKDDERLVAFITRENPCLAPIDLYHHVVASNTSLLTITEYLNHNHFCFVLVGNSLEGYIHFSDLNHRLVKLNFFAIIEAVESSTIDNIRAHICESTLETVLGAIRANTLKKRMMGLQRRQANLDWESLLSLQDILKYARHFDGLAVTDTEMEIIYVVRNRVSHAPTPFITSHADAQRLVQVKDICLRILREEKW